jgi:hypothetical protein
MFLYSNYLQRQNELRFHLLLCWSSESSKICQVILEGKCLHKDFGWKEKAYSEENNILMKLQLCLLQGGVEVCSLKEIIHLLLT